MNRNRKLIVGTLSVTLAATVGVGAVYGRRLLPENEAGVPETEESADADKQEEKTEKKSRPVSDNFTVSKEETVYVTANADGSVKEVSVSDWLKNSGNTVGALLDKTDLTDIQNVKGDETFLQDGRTLVWNMNNEDIYYQGNTTQKLPIDMTITYYLNDEKITPAELAGKNGHLRMEVSFDNKAVVQKKVDGKNTDVYSPFVTVTGMLLPNDHFSNISVDNGKCVSDGTRYIVLGYAMPGLKENLKLSDKLLGQLPVSDGFTLEADVYDFEMEGTYTAALTDLFSDINPDDIDGLDELNDALNQLDSAAMKLVDGSRQLKSGTHELNEKYQTFADGLQQLSDGITQLSTGSGTLQTGLKTYTDGVDTLGSGIKEYTSGVETLGNGVKQYTAGVGTLADGLTQYTNGVDTLGKGVKQYAAGVDTLGSGVKQYTAGVDTLGNSLKQYTDGVDTLGSGVKKYTDGVETLGNGVKQYTAGVDTLGAGVKQYTAGTDQLSKGILTYTDGVSTLGEGVKKYTDGVAQLASGMDGYKEGWGVLSEGIRAYLKGADTLSDGLQRFVNGAMTLTDGMGTYVTGVDTYADGVEQYLDGETALVDGIGQLVPGINAEVEGIGTAVSALSEVAQAVQELDLDPDVVSEIQRHIQGVNELVKTVLSYAQNVKDLLEGIGQVETEDTRLKQLAASYQEKFNRAAEKLQENASVLSDILSSLTGAEENVARTKDEAGQTLLNAAGQLRALAAALENQPQTVVSSTPEYVNSMPGVPEPEPSVDVAVQDLQPDAALPGAEQDVGQSLLFDMGDFSSDSVAAQDEVSMDSMMVQDDLPMASVTMQDDLSTDSMTAQDDLFVDSDYGLSDFSLDSMSDVSGFTMDSMPDLDDFSANFVTTQEDVPTSFATGQDSFSIDSMSGLGDFSMDPVTGLDDFSMESMTDLDGFSMDSVGDLGDSLMGSVPAPAGNQTDAFQIPDLDMSGFPTDSLQMNDIQTGSLLSEGNRTAPVYTGASVMTAEVDPSVIQSLYALADTLEGAGTQVDQSLGNAENALTQALGQLDGLTAGMAQQDMDAVSGALTEDGQNTEYGNLLSGDSGAVEELKKQLEDQALQMLDHGEKALHLLNTISSLLDKLSSVDPQTMQEQFKQLQDGADALAAGNAKLQEAYSSETLTSAQQSLRGGAASLRQGGEEITAGIHALQGDQNANVQALLDGSSRLSESSKTLENGLTQFESATTQVSDGIASLNSNSPALNNGVAQLENAKSQLDNGATQLMNNSSQLNSGADQLMSSSGQLTGGADKLTSSSAQINSGVSQLTGNSGQLNSGVDKLTSASSQLTGGVSQLTGNSAKLNDGVKQLKEGADKLKDGAGKLSDGSGQVQEGIGQLDEGAGQLYSGEKQFYTEGIKELTDTVGGELDGIVDRLKLLQDEDVVYNSFSGKPDDMDSSVKFIIETAAVEKPEKDL